MGGASILGVNLNGVTLKWLQDLGDLVVEFQKDGHISKAWTRDQKFKKLFVDNYLGKSVEEIEHEYMVKYTKDVLKEIFVTQKPTAINFSGCEFLGITSLVNIRYIVAFYDPNAVLAIFTRPNENKGSISVEEGWINAVNAIGDGYWDCNYDEGTVVVYEKWKQLFGYENTELSTSFEMLDSLIHPDDLPILRKDFQDYVDGKTDHFYNEHRKLCKDGTYKWILSRGYLLSRKEDGSPRRMIGTDIDISLLKNAQEMLRVSRETFSNAFNYSGIGMSLSTITGKWIDVNHALLKMLGYSREEFLAKSYRDLAHHEDGNKERKFVIRMLKGEIESYSTEKRYIAKNGKIVWTILNVCLVRNEDQSPKFFIAQITDISYQKELIEQLNEKTMSLQSTSEALQKKIMQLEDVNNMVAHNLRGPSGNIQALIEGYLEYPESFPLEETLQHIRESSIVLRDSLSTLMELTQIRLNKGVLYEECSIEEKVEDIKKQLANLLQQTNATIELQLQVESINYPSAYMESLLYNLISNALKYSKPNESCHILIATRKEGENVILSVKDNGLGIDLTKYKDKLFKINQTFHKGVDSKGLGLYLTKAQIETLGGNIDVKSEVNNGTEFIVTIANSQSMW